ncbi:A/G-specific adenine glycosylase [Cupriavidus sp. AU9028]|uniref:A/G-specific adenine glycosylase n=1 Tax=Cupriavidus sp. AU9028 TaxID=2871157 RepID=UPI001C9892DA|nr:A/G-specific adenine glycosylase [Cupriavidus sp. AU9028]MBY4896529.1 A/G-specific adenine glycosylase [Cupriavidus sp. AU9028]
MPRRSSSPTLPAPAATPQAPTLPADFGERIVRWQRAHGRHDLPWQNTRDAYRIWLSEIMLQQTQVAAVIGYYQRFVAEFPDVAALAAAPAERVMALWAGLGYYSRARNLHRCARIVVEQHGGVFPSDPALLATLPGIGRSTAAAIAAFSAGVRAPILDGNVKRVFARCFGIEGYPGEKAVENRMWDIAAQVLPAPGPAQADDMVAYTQGLMDLGATVCTRGKPACLVDPSRCPLADRCVALRDGLTARLPTPRTRAPLPERSTVMLLIRHGRNVLLRQRPEQGIWGGLWSLPEMPVSGIPFDDEAAQDDAMANAAAFGVTGHATMLAELTHVFTHFRLHIRVIRVDMAARSLQDGEPAVLGGGPWRWISLDALDAVGMPAPVRALLQTQARPALF